MFLKFVFYCIAAYLAFRLARSFLRYLAAPVSPRAGASNPGRRRTNAGVSKSAQMIRCETCGMFITQNSAILAGGQRFCSEECAESKVHSS